MKANSWIVWGIAGLALLGGAVALILSRKPTPPCTPGQTKCVGYDKYTCVDGAWVLVEQNSADCGYQPPACTPGQTKCVGYDKYTCVDGVWELTEQNAASCGYQPPPQTIHLGLQGFNYPSWVNQEDIVILIGPNESTWLRTGKRSPGQVAWFDIPNELTWAEFWLYQTPSDVNPYDKAQVSFGGYENGDVVRVDIAAALQF